MVPLLLFFLATVMQLAENPPSYSIRC
uniref:Uncharacterized protein n=1 Tax=Arundo donax TaxID=35708 RepID=A0A0A9GYZ0_ARUDO